MIKIRGTLEENASNPPLSSEKDDELKLMSYTDALTAALKMLEDLASEDDN